MSLKEILSALSSKPYQRYIDFHNNNIFSITKVSRQELFHSNFLSWLFNSKENHGLGIFPVKRLLSLIAFSKTKEENENNVINEKARLEKSLVIPFLSSSFDITTSSTTREEAFYQQDGKLRYIDLIVEITTKEGKILPIVIENKINSHEHSEQTKSYFDYSEAKYRDTRHFLEPIYIYLLPDFNTSKCTQKEFLKVSYQDLLDYVLEPCFWKCQNNTTKYFIEQYIKCMSYQDDTKVGGVIAMCSDEKEIMRDFVENNKGFIDSLIKYLIDDPDTDNTAKEALIKYQKASKDYSKYYYNGKKYNKRGLVYAVMSDYVNTQKPSSIDEIQKDFNLNRRWIALADEIKDESRYYPNRFPTGDGTEFVISNQWGKDSLKPFIDCAKNLGISIIEEHNMLQ